MTRDVLVDEPVLLRVDRGRPGRELIDQRVAHPGDLPRGVAVPAAIASFPPQPEDTGEVVGEHRVVVLRQRDHGRVHGPAIQRPPLPVRCLHPVRDHDMRVQLRVARAGIEVIERGRHRAPHVDLRDTVRACPARRDVTLDQIDDFPDCRVMGLSDQCLCAAVCNGPEYGDRFRDGEGVVIPGDGARALAFLLLTDDVLHRGFPLLSVQILGQPASADLHPLPQRLEREVRPPELLTRRRMLTPSQQMTKLGLRHHLTVRDGRILETGQTSTKPESRRGSRLRVIAGQ